MATRPHSKKPSRTDLRRQALETAARVELPTSCDTCVIGGGASGLVAAITAAEAGANVVVLERDLECGRKILATGNGRCNFANKALGLSHYRNEDFVAKVTGPHWLEDVLGFFKASGLAWDTEEGRLYPLSRQAASVRAVLLARARRAGVTLAPAREVTGLARKIGRTWDVTWSGIEPREKCAPPAGQIAAESVVVACGGSSAVTDSLGLPCVEKSPVLCALACKPAGESLDLARIDGRRAHARARLLRDGNVLWTEDGEVLFRPWGVSGICVFDLSRRATPGDVISLDLTSGMSAENVRTLTAAGCVEGVVDPLIAAALGGAPVAEKLEHVRDLRLTVTGLAETERAQVTRGGLDVTGFSPKSLGATGAPGLFACGEALDVDADCGGFNLAWAWRSGQVAGSSAALCAMNRNGE